MAVKSFALGRLEGGNISLLGTCFFVRRNTFATAAHNLEANDTNLVAVLPEDLNDFNSYQSLTRENFRCLPLTLKDIDPLHDLALLACADGANIMYPQVPTLASTDSLRVGDKVHSLGYPHSQWGSAIMVQQETIVGARVIVSKGSLKICHIIINQQSVRGQSGAPIYADRSGAIVGILVGAFAPTGGGISLGGVDPHTLHQTSYVVSAEYLAEMLQ